LKVFTVRAAQRVDADLAASSSSVGALLAPLLDVAVDEIRNLVVIET
jgi:hypothetical protein